MPNTTKHTQGPWEAVKSIRNDIYRLTSWDVSDDDGNMICDLAELDNAQANARLIAASPALLEALEKAEAKLTALYSADSSLVEGDALTSARAALNQARGL